MSDELTLYKKMLSDCEACGKPCFEDQLKDHFEMKFCPDCVDEQESHFAESEVYHDARH